MDAESANECLAMIRETLKTLGCCCPEGVHDETPPSCYPEWIACVVEIDDGRRGDRGTTEERK